MAGGLRVTFEGLVASDGIAAVPAEYLGLYWLNVTVAGRAYLDARFGEVEDGYGTARSGDVVAWGNPMNTIESEVLIIAPEGKLFTFSKGDFASAWNIGQTLTFTAFKNGQQKGLLTVTIDTSVDTITFGRGFKNIDELVIVSSGGEAAFPDSGFPASPIFAFDNLRIGIKLLSASPETDLDAAPAVAALYPLPMDFGQMERPWQSHSADWYF
jgi:hypothetical protein